jgi:tetracycline repressor-like protein
MPPELRDLVEDYERLWAVPGFAERFAANLAGSGAPVLDEDPYQAVLAEHHRRLVAALRRARHRGELSPDRDLDHLADAIIGSYLSRRVARAPLDGWASAALATVLA